MAERPADRCPYRRPFSDDFRGCAAYQPNQFVGLDTGYRPLSVVWTCAHLESAPTAQRSRYYAKCRIGDAVARGAWVASQRVDRLAAIRALSDEMSPVFADMITPLWAEKARQLRSEAGTAEWRDATARLRELGGQFMVRLEAAFEEQAERLLALGFPIEPCLRLFDDLIARWIEQPTTEPPVIPDSALDPFPPDTRVFFKPDYVDASAR